LLILRSPKKARRHPPGSEVAVSPNLNGLRVDLRDSADDRSTQLILKLNLRTHAEGPGSALLQLPVPDLQGSGNCPNIVEGRKSEDSLRDFVSGHLSVPFPIKPL